MMRGIGHFYFENNEFFSSIVIRYVSGTRYLLEFKFPKSTYSSFYLKSKVFQNGPKTENILATFVRKFTMNF